MSLEVNIGGSSNLTTGKGSKTSFSVQVDLRGVKKETTAKSDTTEPTWDEKIVYDFTGLKPVSTEDTLFISLKSNDKIIGNGTVPLSVVVNGKEPQNCEVKLEDSNKSSVGTLYITLVYNSENGGSSSKGKFMTSFAKTRQFSNKPEKFQIRVKVIEARQLIGDSINPLCTVRFLDDLRQTKVERETDTPYWNETFLFNITKLATELFEDSVVFQVLNSKRMRAKALIGSYTLSIQSIYNEVNHSYINKWLGLGNPDDDTAGVMGFLKISIAVLATGDECPNFNICSKDDDEEDIETNVLWPDTGISLQPATFSLFLYKAEDLPPMDAAVMDEIKKFFGQQSEDKQLVDPYLIFSYCGRKVSSKIIYTNDHPEWFQILNVGFSFPSLCKAVKLTLMDWDRMSQDDTIATSTMDLSTVSSSGEEGFLPTFGPCYINFYGSTRQFSTIQNNFDEEVNTGKYEGFTYRGRVLLALKTVLGAQPDNEVEPIEFDEQLRISPYCRRRKYLLKAQFIGANLMSEITDPIEFEVSMGLYGDKNETRTLPSISTTQPTNAIFDGSMYYFMPWLKEKPVVMIPCQWEDISFRLEGLNIIEHAIQNLDKGISMLMQFQRAGISCSEQEFLINGILEQLKGDCSVEFPEPLPGYHVATELDKFIQVMRKRKMSDIIEQAQQLQDKGPQDLSLILDDLNVLKTVLQSMAVEPQNSMPDIIVSMIVAKKKVAYYRIPANSLLHSPNENMRGILCNKIQMLTLKTPGNRQSEKIPVILQIKMWFGLDSQHSMVKHNEDEHSDIAIYAETFENQVNILGSWKSRSPTLTRPAWSDASGLLTLPQDAFSAPSGWAFEGDWFINPQLDPEPEKDTGNNSFVEVLIENQSRSLTGMWRHANTPWTDIRGNPSVAHCDLECPPGWEWEDCWEVDLKRAVDEEGWEYAIDSTFGGFSSAEKTFHMFRCRRWFCRRILTDPSLAKFVDSKEKQLSQEEGWEYAPTFSSRFHTSRQKLDMVRRKRWHRKLIPKTEGSLPLFHFADTKRTTSPGKDDSTSGPPTYFHVPRMFLVFKDEFKYQLNVYLYQARGLIAGDKSGFSDPFACICFHTRTQKSEVIKQTLCPQWDQTFVFERIPFCCSVDAVEPYVPQIVVEIYDHDNIGSPELLGRTSFEARINKTANYEDIPLNMNWYPVKRGEKDGGEILAVAELCQCNTDIVPRQLPKEGNLFKIPPTIKPILCRMAVEILCWGVRNMKTYELLSVTHPSVTFEIGAHTIQSTIIKNIKENPNFESPLLFLDLYLPEEQLYMPPVNIKVRDHRQFGRTPIVGVHVIKSLQPFYSTPRSNDNAEDTDSDSEGSQNWPEDAAITIPEENMEENPDDLDWWAKYYASIEDFQKSADFVQQGYEPLQFYDVELERIEPYGHFRDFLSTFELHRGKNISDDSDGSVGEFKGTLRVYPLPGDSTEALPPRILQWIPTTSIEEVVVRVYIIRASDLAPKDPNGLADPYITIKLGKQKQSSRDRYKPKTLNPLFGQMFELTTTLPLQKDLLIQVYDMDLIGSDDLIGQTTIDLENRFLSQHRATRGLPTQYFTKGPYRWRDVKTPKEILLDVCKARNMPSPKFKRGALHLGKLMYSIYDFEKKGKQTPPDLGPCDQRIALHVLHTLDLVPEHVETRRLYNPVVPGIDQGKLEMWVDIFPKSVASTSPPVNISPRETQRYELRCVIWNTKDVAFKDVNIAGEEMSDIYVKAWIDGVKDVQKTDIHYRSTTGEGNFNWRFVFSFDYLKAEKMIKVNKKEHFWEVDSREYFYSPKLCIQIWDSDIFASDDFIGYLELDLLNLFRPVKESEHCSLKQVRAKKKKNKKRWWKNSLKKSKQYNEAECLDLFEKKHIYGHWPCIDDGGEEVLLTGKVEMELELLNAQEADERPAGKGRDEPNAHPHLEPPKRPDIMFKMLLTPWKAFRHGVWDKIKWHVLTVLLILLLVFFVLIGLYTLPQAAVNKIVTSF